MEAGQREHENAGHDERHTEDHAAGNDLAQKPAAHTQGGHANQVQRKKLG